MANTFTKLSSTTVGAGGASTISFTNIPQTYTDLKILVSSRRSAGNVWGTYTLTANNNTITNYNSTRLIGDGATATGNLYNSVANYTVSEGVGSGSTANIFDNTEITIFNYCSADTFKVIQSDSVGENVATTAYITKSGALLQILEPLTSIVLTSGSGTLVEYTTATLYGIFNADVSTAPATPTIGTATANGREASVAFTEVSNAASYTITSSPSSITATGTSTPIVVGGLATNTAYTFTVKANNPFGSSAASAASNSTTTTAAAFDSLQSIYTLYSGVTSVTFTNIPSTYTHLQIRGQVRNTEATTGVQGVGFRFNGDTGANYALQYQRNENATAGYGATTANTSGTIRDCSPRANNTASYYGAFVLDILEYASTSKTKVTKSVSGTGYNTTSGNYVGVQGNIWNNTSAITSITFFPETAGFTRYSSFDLYGIKG